MISNDVCCCSVICIRSIIWLSHSRALLDTQMGPNNLHTVPNESLVTSKEGDKT